MIHKNQLIILISNKIALEEQERGRIITKAEKLFILREQLQLLLLEDLYSSKDFSKVFFMWWTNLRLCYSLPRYSEDMDFTILDKSSVPDTDNISQIIKASIDWFEIEDISWRTNFNITKTNIIFPWLPYECWIEEAHRQEKIDIKFEIDTMPSEWGKSEATTIFFWEKPIRILHHTLDTTFAWKISAILMRQYTKWRDYFDIDWYLRKKTYAPFSLDYVNWNIRRYNKMNENREDFVSLKEFKTHKEVLESVWDRIANLNDTEKNRIEGDIRRFVFWDKERESIYIENFYERINEWISNYYNNIKNKIEWWEVSKTVNKFTL